MEKEEYDPNDLSIKNAYATRWIYYHTALFFTLLLADILLIGIICILAIKLWALSEEERKRIAKQRKNITKRCGKRFLKRRRKKMTSKGDMPRPVNKKKFDEEFERIFKK